MTSSAGAQRFPLDFDALRRGDYLPADVVEVAVSCSRSTVRYSIEVLRLCQMIRTAFMERGEGMVTVCRDGDGVRILTHEEQAEYAENRQARGIRNIFVAGIEARSVDPAQLRNDEQRKRLDRFLQVNAWRMQQLAKKAPPQFPPPAKELSE